MDRLGDVAYTLAQAHIHGKVALETLSSSQQMESFHTSSFQAGLREASQVLVSSLPEHTFEYANNSDTRQSNFPGVIINRKSPVSVLETLTIDHTD